jgi:hypothetical protein
LVTHWTLSSAFVTLVMCSGCGHSTDSARHGATATQRNPSQLELPCSFSGELLRTTDGNVVRYQSDQMKSLAVRRVELSDFVRKADIKGSVVVDVLVDPSGQVVCLSSRTGHPLLRREVERALTAWTFKPVQMRDGVACLEFELCNISCGERGPSMTLLR